MKAVVDLADRQADERYDHQHVAAELVGYLERKIEQRACDNIESDHDQHHDERSDTNKLADPLDDAFANDSRGRTVGRWLVGEMRHRRCQRPSATRTLASASTTSGPRDFAHSSQ